MTYRYLVLASPEEEAVRSTVASLSNGLQRVGLSLRAVLGSVAVFASEETPTVALSTGGVAIGQIFTRQGACISSLSVPPNHGAEAGSHTYVMRQLWGEYVLVEHSGPGESRITRDPSGSVGCVYGRLDRTDFITSDISIPISAGLYSKAVDWDFIASFVAYPNHKSRRTGLRGVQELLPGCSLVLRDAAAETECGWSPWEFVSGPNRFSDEGEAARSVFDAVRNSVLALSSTTDSILLELSGGLDSSIVGACLRDGPAQVTACTITTPVPGADERRYVRMITGKFGFPLHCGELTFDSARIEFKPPPHSVTPCMTALQHANDSLIEAMGVRHRINSYFSGGGGDTVFCYSSTSAPATDAIREQGLGRGLKAVRDLAELHQCTFWRAARLTFLKLVRTPRASLTADRSFLSVSAAADAPELHPWVAAPDGALHGDRERITSLAGAQMFRDGLPRGMHKRLHMPLLSQPVMETCLRVPSWMWIADGLNRAVARSAFSGLLPPEILQRRSKGTFLCYSGSVLRRSKTKVRDLLLSGRLRGHGLLDVQALEAALAEHAPVKEESLQRIFDLCMVENWVRHQE